MLAVVVGGVSVRYVRARASVFANNVFCVVARYVDFQCISDPVRTLPGVTYHQAKADNIDLEEQLVHCRDIFKNHYFTVP